MTLGFMEEFPKGTGSLEGTSTCFVEKIWTGLVSENKHIHLDDYEEYLSRYNSKFDRDFSHEDMMINPKLHTMRKDEKGLWKSGNDIHFVINNRTENRFQFAPIISCVSTQKVEIKYNGLIISKANRENIAVKIDGNYIGGACWDYKNKKYKDNLFDEKMKQLAINDGFDSVEDFFKYFNTDWKGTLIHWTNLKY